MRNIDFTKCWDNGVFRASKLYHVAFNKLHNTYKNIYISIKKNKKIKKDVCVYGKYK